MKRKVVSILLCAAMVMAMAGCGSSTQEETAENAAESTQTSDTSSEDVSDDASPAIPPQFASGWGDTSQAFDPLAVE